MKNKVKLILLSLLATACLATPATAQFEDVRVDPGTKALLVPLGGTLVQIFTSATRAATAPWNTHVLGYQTDTATLWSPTGTSAGNWSAISTGSTYTFSTGLTNTAGTITVNAINLAGGSSVVTGTLPDSNLPSALNIDHLTPSVGTLTISGGAYNVSGLLQVDTTNGFVNLGDHGSAVNNTNLTVDDATQTVDVSAMFFAWNGNAILTAASSIPFANISGTSGSALLMGNGSGGIGNVTLGTGLSFSGTTLNAAGGSPGGSSGQVQYNNAGAFGGVSGITLNSGTLAAATLTGANDSTLLTLTGGSITGSGATPFASVTGAWNTTGTPTAIKANITDTASNAASLLMDLQVGGTSKFSVGKNGTFTSTQIKTDAFGNVVTNGTALYFQPSGSDTGRFINDGTTADIYISGTDRLHISATGITVSNSVSWFSGSGSPEGAVAANVGSLYSRTDGGASSTLYVKESGTGNTGWVAK